MSSDLEKGSSTTSSSSSSSDSSYTSLPSTMKSPDSHSLAAAHAGPSYQTMSNSETSSSTASSSSISTSSASSTTSSTVSSSTTSHTDSTAHSLPVTASTSLHPPSKSSSSSSPYVYDDAHECCHGLGHTCAVMCGCVDDKHHRQDLHVKKAPTVAAQALCCTLPTTIHGVRKLSIASFVCLLIGIGMILLAALVPPALNNLLLTSLRNAVILDSPDSSGFSKWQDNSNNPLLLNIYVYDLQNPEEVVNNGSVPILIERGPYVYRDYQYKYNVSWSADTTRIRYRTWEHFEFAPDLSVGSDLNDTITTLNVPFIGLYNWEGSRDALFALYALMKFQRFDYWNRTQAEVLFVKKPIRDILFGYHDAFFEFVVLEQSTYQGFFKNVTSLENATVTMPQSLYNEIDTGVSNLNNIRSWYEFQGDRDVVTTCKRPYPQYTSTNLCTEKIPVWRDNASSLLSGRDGSQFPPPVSSTDNLVVWYSPIDRAIPLQFVTNSQYKGIDLLRFTFPESIALNATMNPENAKYFQFGPSGIFNVSHVQGESPLYFSNPRFAGVDSSVTSQFNITYVDNNPISTMFEVEPTSGATFHVVSASQLMLKIEPLYFPTRDPNVTDVLFANLTPTYFPVFWAKEEGGISDADAKTFRDGISAIHTLDRVSLVGGLTIGIFLILLNLFLLAQAYRRYRDIKSGKILPSIGRANQQHTTSLLSPDVLVMKSDEVDHIDNLTEEEKKKRRKHTPDPEPVDLSLESQRRSSKVHKHKSTKVDSETQDPEDVTVAYQTED